VARSIVYASAVVGSATIAAALTAQVAPDVRGPVAPDIVVNGATPRMIAGLWRFRSGIRLTDPVPGRARVPPGRGQDWDRCITDGDTPAIVAQLIGVQAGVQMAGDNGTLCSALTLTIDRARAVGNRRCTQTLIDDDGQGPSLQTTTGLRATLAATRVNADYVMEAGTARGPSRTTRWRVTAERVGDCPGSRRPGPSLAASPSPVEQRIATPTLDGTQKPQIIRETTAAPMDMDVSAWHQFTMFPSTP
jgi:hypothetical protein